MSGTFQRIKKRKKECQKLNDEGMKDEGGLNTAQVCQKSVIFNLPLLSFSFDAHPSPIHPSIVRHILLDILFFLSPSLFPECQL